MEYKQLRLDFDEVIKKEENKEIAEWVKSDKANDPEFINFVNKLFNTCKQC